MSEEKRSLAESRRLIKSLKTADKRLRSLFGKHEKNEKAVADALEAYRRTLVTEALKNTPVSELSRAKAGIRTSVLEDAGIRSIYQLRGRSVSSLTSIRGIGDASARKIVKAVKELEKAIDEDTPVRFSVDKKTPAATALLRELYRYTKYESLSEQAESLYGDTHGTAEELIKTSKPATGWLRRLFSSKTRREEAEAAVEEAARFCTDGYSDRTAELFREEIAVLKAKHDDYWKDYAANSATYYAIIDRISGKAGKKKKNAVRRSGITGNLPEELAIAVDKVEPDLTGLRCTLRSYQLTGVKYVLHQGAVLLGDEMGLGKTVQAIGVMVALRNAGATHFAVVCPASVLVNWCREIEKHSDLKACALHGQDISDDIAKWSESGGVGVTTYEASAKLTVPEGIKLAMLVVDEAHYVKNPEAQRTASVLRLRAATDRVLFMTGTALENRVDEMKFIISCLQPDVEKTVRNISALSSAAEFRNRIASVYFRRTQEDVMKELPEKIEVEDWCRLTSDEADVYAASVEDKNFMAMRQVSWNCGAEDSSKSQRLREICGEAMENGRKVIVFSFFLGTIEKVQSLLVETFGEDADRKVFGPINGSVTPEKRQSIIDDFTAAEGGAVLLSQITAGGTGLNIQAASVIIFCEPQLKPSLETQAIARAYRMGQVNTVMVHRLLAEKTVDERIIRVLEEKQKLFDSFADKSVSGDESIRLSEDEFDRLMDEERERLRK